jgi:hypothetical protein
MNTIEGAFAFACSNRSRTREAPTPTNISTKSEPEIEKNGTPASPATARASNVFPVQYALRDLGAHRLELLGGLEVLLDLLELLDRFVEARDIAERDLRRILGDETSLRFAERHDPVAAPLHLLHQEDEEAHDQDDRQELEQCGEKERARLGIGRDFNPAVDRDLLVLVDRLGRKVQLVLATGRVLADDLLVFGQELRRGDVAVLDPLDPLVDGSNGLDLVRAGPVQVVDPDHGYDDDQIGDGGSEDAVHGKRVAAPCF